MVVLTFRPAPVDLELQQGDDWSETFTLYTDALRTTPMDLTGYTGYAQIRDDYADRSTVTINLTVVFPTPSNGGVKVGFTRTQSLTLPPKGRWELALVSAADFDRKYLSGKVTTALQTARLS